MSQTSCETDLTILNRKGLHARAAASFVKALDDIEADVTVTRLGQTVSGRSIMGLMMLAASQNTTIHIAATGADAERAVSKLTLLVNAKFGEES
jgi:phosphocarrier protein